MTLGRVVDDRDLRCPRTTSMPRFATVGYTLIGAESVGSSIDVFSRTPRFSCDKI
jgi:hypothetical protein